MVCYMYYTDVFVGTDNIVKLKTALEAELGSFKDNSNALNQLVQGLCLFMGYPSCLCKPKKSVKESLRKISKELKEELKNYKCLSKPSLNCNSSCSDSVVCKCCVLDCIREVQSSCGCVQGSNNTCTCSSVEPKRCCKDLLERLKASLSLLNLKADMNEICECTGDCCVDGECTQKGSSTCNHCSKLKTSKDYTVTGLGLLRPSPIRLAGRLNEFFGTGPKSSSGCSCNGSPCTCCCLACDSNQCAQACSCNTSGCSCDKALKASPCPRQKFCLAINGIKIAAEAGVRTCCKGGKKCHCEVDTPNCQATSSSGQKCCIENSNGHYKHSLKCMIRRLVTYFKELKSDTSNKGCFKNCCELLCVVKTCEFLNNTLKDTSKGDGKNFHDALKELRLGGPCGQELYRTLDDFLNFCCKVFWPRVNVIRVALENLHKKCQCTPGSCKCSSNSSCPGCAQVLEELKKLQAHKDVLSLMTRGYSSAYSSEASWDSLTSSSNSGPCCGSLSSCSCPSNCSSGSSCPSQCCPECPQRKAAKIFLGFLPCMYWGLKILHDRSKYNSGFAGWNLAKIPEAPRLTDFLTSWGFTSSHLSSKNASGLPPVLGILYGSSGIFDKIYKEVSEKYFSHSLSPSSQSPPTTVRELLLWLYGLPFTSGFPSLVENSKSLCSPFGNSFHPDAFCYYIYTCCFIVPVSVISVIQCPDGSPSFLPSPSDWKDFSYPSDTLELFENFCDFVRKVFVALTFLKFQCDLDKDSAGWKYCAFGKTCAEKFQEISSTSVPSLSTSSSGCDCKYSGAYLCTAINKDPVHDHCLKGSCRGLDECNQNSVSVHTNPKANCKDPCPHPLQRFLIDGSSDSDSHPENSQKFRTPFHSSTVTPMGFSAKDLPSPGKKGFNLYYVLKVFCESGFYPLTRLAEFSLCVSRHPPETLGELYAFFKKFVEALNSGPLKDNFVQWINGEPGWYPGKALKDAVQGLYGSEDSHSGSTSHLPNLRSLVDCHAKKGSSGTSPTCGPYLYPLTDNVSGVFTPELCSMYLSWICHLTKDFYSEFQKFHTAAHEKFKSCCSSSCKNIVSCPCALPFLYSNGFQFNSPKTLSCPGHGGHNPPGKDKDCTLKSCSQFLTQLDNVVKGDPFKALLRIIDEFIWSIRLPFIYAFLYIWILVISYFYYVQLYKLDLLHIDSHLHLPRSFKILPSTLFSDASSKLKDLSYFTL
ncbi:variant erythrocyte surface antigen-1 family protein [Babesia divergens]|uniref:Variant erythrocyte surface antigen-1 family protein n=1 Tax=Babesia divergens TaxID=32595 RepID=A0AAD9LE51_BABDI|nr:variant erythrocyte surface antigen-1 family protein [Babesia divergens]